MSRGERPRPRRPAGAAPAAPAWEAPASTGALADAAPTALLLATPGAPVKPTAEVAARGGRGAVRESRRAHRQALHAQVRALRAAGASYTAIAVLMGLSRTGVFDICQRAPAPAPAPATPPPPGGRPPAVEAHRRRGLSAAQEGQLCGWLAGHTPEQLLAPPWAVQSPGLWTRLAVAELLRQRLGLVLSARSLDASLLRWGVRPAKPLAQVAEPPASAGNRWLRESYPAILAQARLEGAEIQWAGLGEGPGGPAGGAPGAWLCSVSNRGLMRWRHLPGGGQPGGLEWLDFLARLLDGAGRKLFLIVVRAPWQRGLAVRRRLVELEDRLALFVRPAGR